MSDARSRALHDAHLDARIEHATRVRLLAEHEAVVTERENARWRRRVLPLLPRETQVEDVDFPGCFW